MESASFLNENQKAEDFFILLDTVINERTYILASESDPDVDEDAECFIMKKVGEDEESAVYEPVEDEEEFTSVSKVFEELLSEEDIDLR